MTNAWRKPSCRLACAVSGHHHFRGGGSSGSGGSFSQREADQGRHRTSLGALMTALTHQNPTETSHWNRPLNPSSSVSGQARPTSSIPSVTSSQYLNCRDMRTLQIACMPIVPWNPPFPGTVKLSTRGPEILFCLSCPSLPLVHCLARVIRVRTKSDEKRCGVG